MVTGTTFKNHSGIKILYKKQEVRPANHHLRSKLELMKPRRTSSLLGRDPLAESIRAAKKLENGKVLKVMKIE
jgi:hypothetical protein